MTVVVRTKLLQYSNEEVIGKKNILQYNLRHILLLPAIRCWGARAKQT